MRAWWLFLAAAACWIHASTAEACSTYGQLQGTLPPQWCGLPSNGRVVLLGFELESDALVVTSGEPAIAIGEASTFRNGLVFDLDPDPTPFTTLHIEGDACPDWRDSSCDLSLDLVIVDPDLVPPSPPSRIAFDVYDYNPGPCDPTECIGGLDLEYAVTVELPELEEPTFLHIVAIGSMHVVPVTPYTVLVTPGDAVVGHVFSLESVDVPGDPIVARCFDAYLEDAAGNASATLSTCDACRARIEPPEAEPACSKPLPRWTDADLVGDPSCIPPAIVDLDGTLPLNCPPPHQDPNPLPDPDPDSESGEPQGDSTGTTSPAENELADRGGCACTSAKNHDVGACAIWLAIAAFVRRRRSLSS